ncbi:MAG: hypothetical protein WC748_02870 [Legionellales bacterium]|jgi:hypothetical protein
MAINTLNTQAATLLELRTLKSEIQDLRYKIKGCESKLSLQIMDSELKLQQQIYNHKLILLYIIGVGVIGLELVVLYTFAK